MAESDIIESNNLGSFYKYINKRMNQIIVTLLPQSLIKMVT